MSNNSPSMRYVGLQQQTSIPTGYQQSAARPDAASTISRNGHWPVSTPAGKVDVIPLGDFMRPSDNSSSIGVIVTTLRR